MIPAGSMSLRPEIKFGRPKWPLIDLGEMYIDVWTECPCVLQDFLSVEVWMLGIWFQHLRNSFYVSLPNIGSNLLLFIGS